MDSRVEPSVVPCPGIYASSPASESLSLPPGPWPRCPGVVLGTYLGGATEDKARGVAVDAALNIYVIGTTSMGFPTTPDAYDSDWNWAIDSFLVKYSVSGEVVYSTLLGGVEDDIARSIALDSAGNVYVAGSTWSWDFPTTTAPYNISHYSYADIFVTKFDPSGALVYATLLGGSDDDEAKAMVVDDAGNAYVTGYTVSEDFPVTSGAYGAHRGTDAFVLKLTPEGGLAYAARLGGARSDEGLSIVVDIDGQAYVTGFTDSPDFPGISTGFDATYSGMVDGFVAKLDAEGSILLYATYLGGADEDFGHDIEVDGDGNVYVAGDTRSSDFPTSTGSFDTTYNGGMDAFVAKFNPEGGLTYSTFFGGEGPEEALALYVQESGSVQVTGYTESATFPTSVGAFDATYNGNGDAFVTKVSLDGASLEYSTFLGGTIPAYDGSGGDTAYSIAVDATGNTTVVGATASLDFPTTDGALDGAYSGLVDAFVTRIDLIPDPNRPPVAHVSISPSVDTPTRVMVDPGLSADAEDLSVTLEARWDWEGDGKWDTAWLALGKAYHEYSVLGPHTIRLEVRDTTGLSDEVFGSIVLIGPSSASLIESFDDNVLDTTAWFVSESGGSTVREASGRLEITHPADAAGASFGARISTPWLLRGDFDVRVEFSLLTYPVLAENGEIVEMEQDTIIERTNGVRVGLGLAGTRHMASVERTNFGARELFATNFGDVVTVVDTRDREGALRLQRTGSTLTAYRSYEGFWVVLRTHGLTSGTLDLGLGSWSHDDYFLDQEVKVAFDNLMVIDSVDLQVSAHPASGDAPLEVFFESTVTGGTPPYDYTWAFGDGESSSEANPTHVYPVPGTFVVVLTLSDAEARRIVRTMEVTVLAATAPPENGVLLFLVVGVAAGVATTSLLVWSRPRRRKRGS